MRQRNIVANTLKRMQNVSAAIALRTWRLMAQARVHQRRVVSSCLRRMTNTLVSGAVDRWVEFVELVRKLPRPTPPARPGCSYACWLAEAVPACCAPQGGAEIFPFTGCQVILAVAGAPT